MSDSVIHAVFGTQQKTWLEELAEDCDRYYAALQHIVKTLGHVCPDFTTCGHVACNDSAGAWLVADAALRGEDPPHD